MFKENYIFVAGDSIKQHYTAEYLGCQLDSKLSGEALVSNIFRKINAKLKFLFRESIYLIPALRKLLGTALIQGHFDCGCSSWFPLSHKKFKIKLQKTQNRYICFCLNLPPRSPIDPSFFGKIKLHPARDRVEHHFEVPEWNCNGIFIKCFRIKSLMPLEIPLWKTITGQRRLSLFGLKIWSKIPTQCEYGQKDFGVLKILSARYVAKKCINKLLNQGCTMKLHYNLYCL